jgi:uridine kinase
MNSYTISVTFPDGDAIQCPAGIEVGMLLDQHRPEGELPAIAALVNNDVSSLSYPLTVNSEVRFLTMADSHGWRIYRRSLCFLLAKCMHDLFPNTPFSVEHSFGLGLYCSYGINGGPPAGIDDITLAAVEAKMRRDVADNLPIARHKISYRDAITGFEASGQTDKLNLLKHRNPPRVVVHRCGSFSDLAHGPLVPSTGVLTHFTLIPYSPGFVLHLPDRMDPTHVPPFEDQPHLFGIFREHRAWGKTLGVQTIGRLNELIMQNTCDEFIRAAEALHERKLISIADQIVSAGTQLKLVLIAGPSCSGKTTFAKRLTAHLAANGIRPVTLSTDDYFVGETENPLDEEGRPDYEHIEAVDLDLFNEHLKRLTEGQAVSVPVFNFEETRREQRPDLLQIEEDQIILIEGIHGLNPRLTHRIPDDRKFRIYISALTQLSVDQNNRISTTDNRLMRRLVRDFHFRGHSALTSLRLWPSVRRGEKQWIFPFQREADATFNSALDYELAVLKPHVEPLLMQVKPMDPEYAEARRLSEFLLNFLGTDSHAVPGQSILREYIGDSTFTY